MGYVTEHSQRLFKGRTLTKDQVLAMYKPSLIEKDGYQPRIRCKINVSGSKPCRIWNEAFEVRDVPEDFRQCQCVPTALSGQIWIQGSQFGTVMTVQDMLVFERRLVCPFAPE